MRYLVVMSLVVFLISWWNRDNLSADIVVLNALAQEPVQVKTEAPEFSVVVDDIDYAVQPLYEYDLVGLVVSYRHHDGNYGLHRVWGDNLNVSDVCVVWRDNAFTTPLPKLEFWNGQFTCNVKTSDREAWESFKMDQLSNNHLLTNQPHIRKVLKSINVGDQIRIRGWLANYKNGQGASRGTSITREDSGNGACETIFVKQAEVLQSYSSIWRKSMYISLIVFLLSLILYFKAPYRVR